MLTPNKCINLKSVNSLCNGNGTLVTEVPTVVRPVLDVVDSHIHLDKFMQDTGHNDNDIEMEMLLAMKSCLTPLANLLFYVVNNAFLSSDLKRWELTLEIITYPKAKISYSIYPKTAGRLSSIQLQQLLPILCEHLLHSVALAEVGLVFSEVKPDIEAADKQRVALPSMCMIVC